MKQLCVILTIFIGSICFAGESARVGNGGGMLFCQDGRSVLLDYYEAEFNEVYSFNKMKNASSAQRSEMFDKRIRTFDPVMAAFIKKLRIFFHKRKQFVSNAKFKIPDDFLNLYYEDTCDLKVVAVQRKPILSIDKIFFLDKKLWNRADNTAQEGLINHEMLYLISLTLEEENSKNVRQALAYLMSDQFTDNRERFQTRFYDKVTNGGFFSDFTYYVPMMCARLKAYGFNCNNI